MRSTTPEITLLKSLISVRIVLVIGDSLAPIMVLSGLQPGKTIQR